MKMKMKLTVASICILVLCLTFVGYKKSYESNAKPEKVSEINKSEYDSKEPHKRNHNEPIENDIADYITYDYEDRSIYIAGLKTFKEFSTEEFGYSNEGRAEIVTDENVLIFHMTTATGTTTGSLDGPCVYFKVNLDTNEIIEKEFKPAPNYAELGMTKYINHSEEVIELSDERLAEIGVYFKEFILKIEAGLK